MEKEYGSIDQLNTQITHALADEDEVVQVEIDKDHEDEPTMAPVGTRLRRNAQIDYNRVSATRYANVIR